MLAKETIREEVWLRAYEASMARGNGVTSSIGQAAECLLRFDAEFPNHKLTDADLPFGRP